MNIVSSGDIPNDVVRVGRTLTAGDGLSGLGNLSADRTVSIGLSATSGLELVGTSPGKTLQLSDSVSGDGLVIANKALAVGAGTLISVSANAVGLSAGTAQYQVPVTGASPYTLCGSKWFCRRRVRLHRWCI